MDVKKDKELTDKEKEVLINQYEGKLKGLDDDIKTIQSQEDGLTQELNNLKTSKERMIGAALFLENELKELKGEGQPEDGKEAGNK
jgi:uncharacterized membrane protein YukC